MIHFDAHTDFYDTYFGGFRFTHGTPFRRAAEEGLIDTSRVVQIGIRGTAYDGEDVEWARAHGVRIFMIEEVMDRGPDAVMAEAREIVGDQLCYVSFDIDGIDPSQAPGTGTPEIGGFSTHTAQRMVRKLQGLNLIGADLVEVSPPFDPSGMTAWVGVEPHLRAALRAGRRGRPTRRRLRAASGVACLLGSLGVRARCVGLARRLRLAPGAHDVDRDHHRQQDGPADDGERPGIVRAAFHRPSTYPGGWSSRNGRRLPAFRRSESAALAHHDRHTRSRVLLGSGRERRMSEHDGYLDRMTTRLKAFEADLQTWSDRIDERQRRDLRAGLAAVTERLQVLRRAGADLDGEMTQSFTQAFEGLRASFHRVRATAAGGSEAA